MSSEYTNQNSRLNFAYNQLSSQALALANMPLVAVSNDSEYLLHGLKQTNTPLSQSCQNSPRMSPVPSERISLKKSTLQFFDERNKKRSKSTPTRIKVRSKMNMSKVCSTNGSRENCTTDVVTEVLSRSTYRSGSGLSIYGPQYGMIRKSISKENSTNNISTCYK